MKHNYYYLVSSLPHIEFAKDTGISGGSFMLECGKWLSPKDMSALRRADINDLNVKQTDPPAVKIWKRFNIGLKNAIARYRPSAEIGKKEGIPPQIKEIFEEKNPLLMEKKIERIRWNFIEEQYILHHFSLSRLIYYFLKLQIAERLSLFDKEKGIRKFKELSEVNYG